MDRHRSFRLNFRETLHGNLCSKGSIRSIINGNTAQRLAPVPNSPPHHSSSPNTTGVIPSRPTLVPRSSSGRHHPHHVHPTSSRHPPHVHSTSTTRPQHVLRVLLGRSPHANSRYRPGQVTQLSRSLLIRSWGRQGRETGGWYRRREGEEGWC